MSKGEISMDAELKVKEFLQSYGLSPEKYSKKELRTGKTPDFKVHKDNKLSFYCEIKNPEKDSWLDEKIDNSEAGELVGGLRKDPTFNRLTAHIHKARKQFDSVNGDESKPNVLAFYNEDKQSGFLDLLAVTTGYSFAEDGAVFPIYKNYSEGRVKKDIEKIHLFIWLDTYKPHRFLFNTINSRYQRKLCSIFGYDTEKLELGYS